MKKSLRNLVATAVIAATVITASAAIGVTLARYSRSIDSERRPGHL